MPDYNQIIEGFIATLTNLSQKVADQKGWIQLGPGTPMPGTYRNNVTLAWRAAAKAAQPLLQFPSTVAADAVAIDKALDESISLAHILSATTPQDVRDRYVTISNTIVNDLNLLIDGLVGLEAGQKANLKGQSEGVRRV